MESQSAVEYLVTYGWAIVIIAVALGALFSFGVLTPLNNVGQQCLLSSGLSCTINQMATNGLVTINLVQTTPSQINITSISCNSNNIIANAYTYPPSSQITLKPGTNATLSVQCWSGTNKISGALGSAVLGYLFIAYNETFTGFPHTASGRIFTKTSMITPTCLSGGGLICTQSTSGANTIVTFVYSALPGSTTWTVPAKVTVVSYLVVAGGGGGAATTAAPASYVGGGGGGGFLTGTGYAVTPGTQLTVTVGNGGAGGPATTAAFGSNGLNSVFNTITAAGGGGGGAYGSAGLAGGSGGGGGGDASTNRPGGAGSQGNAGGSGYANVGGGQEAGGGGGGAGAVGGSASNSLGGNGGAGLSSSISGALTYYAGGGGGGAAACCGAAGAGGLGGGGSGSTGTGSSGTSSTGGGGGAAGGNGGSGIVIISYTTPS